MSDQYKDAEYDETDPENDRREMLDLMRSFGELDDDEFVPEFRPVVDFLPLDRAALTLDEEIFMGTGGGTEGATDEAAPHPDNGAPPP